MVNPTREKKHHSGAHFHNFITPESSVTSCMSKRAPHTFSSQRAPYTVKIAIQMFWKLWISCCIYNKWMICGQFTAAHHCSGPLKISNHTVLDLVEVLEPLCYICQYVGPSYIWTKTPDFPSFWKSPVVIFCKVMWTNLYVLPRSDIPWFDGFSKAIQGRDRPS